jgi:uncharacterized protein YdeI (YjbR/CyaY-like superfamily)
VRQNPRKSNLTFFRTADDFGRWLEEHHATARELLVGFHKVGSGRPGITWPESVDQALRFGWIDGIRRSVDAGSYSIRFTPRRPGSAWSPINLAKVARLSRAGLMHPAGLAVFKKRKPTRGIYSYGKKPVTLPAAFMKRLKGNAAAWEFFSSRPPSYRNPAMFWIMSAVKPETRERRLEHLISASASKKPIKPLAYGSPTTRRPARIASS